MGRTLRPWKDLLGMPMKTIRSPNLLTHHLKTLWLFTFSDLKTIVGPKTTFGVLSALYAPAFGIDSVQKSATLSTVLITAFWTWINLLPFAIDNQRQTQAIEEDGLNKPWRPLPSKRLTAAQATRLMLVLYPVAFATSLLCGGWRQCLSLIALGHWYNDRGGAESCVTRNVINACGFICFASGAMEVALGIPLPLGTGLFQWFLVIGGVVFSTVQTQDLYDQVGDRARGRKTLPLVVGDGRSRWMTALPIMFWGLFCPWYWGTRCGVSMAFLAIGSVIAARMLLKKNVIDDKTTFKIWNAWMIMLYSLPITKFGMQ